MKRTVQLVFSLVVSVAAVWFSLRHTNLREVGAEIASAKPLPIIEYLAALTAIHFFRTIRWGVLLEPLAKPKFRDLNPLSAVGIMALMVLPLRLGELARPLLAAEYLKVRRTAALASIVVERIIDGLVMALLLVALLWSIPAAEGGEHLLRYRLGGALIALGWGVGLAALVIGVWQHALAVRVLHATVGRFAPRIAHRIEDMLDAFIAGLKVVPSLGKALWFCVLTAGYWFTAGWGLSLLAPAFEGFHLSMSQAFTVLGMQVIGAMIPAGPGMVGTFQLFTSLGVSFFIRDASHDAQVAAFSNVVWLMQFGQQSLFGLWFIATGRVRPGAVFSLFKSSSQTETGVDSASTAERSLVGLAE